MRTHGAVKSRIERWNQKRLRRRHTSRRHHCHFIVIFVTTRLELGTADNAVERVKEQPLNFVENFDFTGSLKHSGQVSVDH